MTTDSNIVAVYGTLRTGNHNARLWDGLAVSIGLDVMPGFRMVAPAMLGFPYAVPDGGDSIVVELIAGYPGSWTDLLGRMDRLEGVPHHYRRYLVRSARGVAAWMYVPAPDVAERLVNDPMITAIASGDWHNQQEQQT